MAIQLQHPQADSERRFQLMVWWGMVSSILVYFIVSKLAVPESVTENPEMVTGLLILALFLSAGSVPVRTHFLSEGGQRTVQQKRQALIVALVMCEAAAILGLIARFAFASPNYYFFFMVAIAGQISHYPRQDN